MLTRSKKQLATDAKFFAKAAVAMQEVFWRFSLFCLVLPSHMMQIIFVSDPFGRYNRALLPTI